MKNINATKLVSLVKKVDSTKVLGTAGLLLSLASTALSNRADEKKLDDLVNKKVREALKKQINK